MNAVEPGTSRRDYAVSGMTCANCARHVGDALRAVPGVDDAQVDLAASRVHVVLKPASQVSTAALQSAVKEAGYELKEIPEVASDSVVLRVEGMDCQSCVRKVTTSLQAVSGVDRVVVDLTRGEARVHWKMAQGSPSDALLDAVKKAGYTASVVETLAAPSESREDFFGGWRLNVLLGGSVTAVLVLAEWVFQLGMERWFQWVAFALATPVQIFCGARFYRGAWNQLKSGNSNMDTLVALGSTTAFAYSVWGLLSGLHGHLYFMEAASIITLISIGHWMEARVSAKAAGSLRALMELAPTTARRLSPDGKESDVPVALLRSGDRVVLKPGDRVPTDGEVGEGASAVDESMLTGESLPVDKMQGDRLYGGTINQNGRLVMQVTATGEATALAQIVAVVQRAQGSRASIQKLGDRVSSVFVPVVVMIAVATALWWGLAGESARSASSWLGQFLWVTHIPDTALAAAVVHAAAVLIIACPCAMGLATPAAIMAGTNAAARRGILIRDGSALEKSGTITAVLFDKTGTLTRGEVVVAQTLDLRAENDREQNLEKLAAGLARGSNHPLSKAIARLDPVSVSSTAPTPGPSIPKPAGKGPASFLTTQFRTTEPASSFTKWEEIRGSGVQAQWSGKT
ncbi:MAG TPA: HAD-IC family P-type ATPase, partial [Roseimicrobium sp.]|nr:HAD-IC family P-type ATPase [Roseimicrobium sp.]